MLYSQIYSSFSRLLWLFEVCINSYLAIYSVQILGLSSISVKKKKQNTGSLVGISLNLWMALSYMYILTILILLIYEQGISSFHLCLQFLLSVSYSFQCVCLSSPWLNLFLSILLFLKLL